MAILAAALLSLGLQQQATTAFSLDNHAGGRLEIQRRHSQNNPNENASAAEGLQKKVERLRKNEIAQAEKLQSAKRIRQSQNQEDNNNNGQPLTEALPLGAMSKWSLPDEEVDENTPLSPCYRLYVNIGRQSRWWMISTWGASGRRLEFTLDVRFVSAPILDKTTAQNLEKRMLLNKKGGKKSAVSLLQTAPLARLRQGQGFDEMSIEGGAYRIDTNQNGIQTTARFFFELVDGKQEGDVVLDPGETLYFSLSVFLGNMSYLSRKEGIVKIRQVGWSMGWNRQKSRIVGVFRAVPLEEARSQDGF